MAGTVRGRSARGGDARDFDAEVRRQRRAGSLAALDAGADKWACMAAGLRPVRLHGLRNAAGSLVARTSDPVFVRDFLGHRKLSTTDRYVSAKARPEEIERLDAAFAPASVPAPAVK